MSPKMAATAFTALAIIIIFMIFSKIGGSNPILGKWRSETSMPFMGKIIDEVEFTSSSVYMKGMKFDADYEIDGNRVILKDNTGIGMIYEMIDDRTMTTDMIGIKTVYRKVD